MPNAGHIEYTNSPLMRAITQGDTKKVKRLLAAGADPYTGYGEASYFGAICTPLMWAARLGHVDITSLLMPIAELASKA